jgi:hypothetical protein
MPGAAQVRLMLLVAALSDMIDDHHHNNDDDGSNNGVGNCVSSCGLAVDWRKYVFHYVGSGITP